MKCITCSQTLSLIRVGQSKNCRWCGQTYEIEMVLEPQQSALEIPTGKNIIPLPVLPSGLPTHDNTMLSSFNRCPRLYETLYIRGKRPNKSTAALDWGSLFHLMLATWYDHMVNQQESHELALLAALEVGMTADFENYEDDFRTKERAFMMMAEYTEWYGYMERRWGWRIIFAETGFDVVGPNFVYGGKIDLLIEWQGKLYIVDHKTTSRFGDDYFTPYVPDTQTAGYVWAGQLLHGEPIAGVFINVIIVHKVKKPMEQQFQRRAFIYPQFFIDEWEYQVLHGLHEVSQARASGHFRPRWQNCTDKYGKCALYYYCRSDPANREKLLAQDFHDYTWDWKKVEVPLAKDRDRAGREGPILLLD